MSARTCWAHGEWQQHEECWPGWPKGHIDLRLVERDMVADYLLNDTNYYLRHAAAVPKQDRKPVRLFDKFLKK